MSKAIVNPILRVLIPAASVAAAGAAVAGDIPLPAATPVFGLSTAPDGSFLVSDVGSGVLEVRKGASSPVASLPGATDVAAIGRGVMFAITSEGFGGDGRLYRVSRGGMREIADLLAFEEEENPDGGIIESNPFNVAVDNGGRAIIADAAGNSLLAADQQGHVEWIATVPSELVSTDNIKSLFGCPGSGSDFCFLPPMLPAQGVATSVAIGPDGSYYVGELKGFPSPTGESRVWKIRPDAHHAQCGVSPDCEVFADGFTSIIDLAMGPDGTLYVAEFDEASWFAVEIGAGIGGSVNACDTTTGACAQIATGLPLLTAVTVGKEGAVSVVINGLIPGAAAIHTLP
jgi:hypothetical protein